MSELIPAILPKIFEDLEDKMNMVAGRVPLVHVDVIDGTLTPGKTWPLVGDNGEWQKILEEKEGMPAWEELNFEVHLMVSDPLVVVDEWVTAGVQRIIIHYEAFEDREDCLLSLRELRGKFSISELIQMMFIIINP